MATMELAPTKEYPKAAPFTPYLMAKKGTKIQERVVHITMSLKVVFIFPMEFKRLVSWVVTAAKTVLTEIRERAIRAGVHFSYLGTISIKMGAKISKPTTEGNTKKQMKKMERVVTLASSSLFSCILEKAGKVTFKTWSIKNLKGV